MEAYCPDGRFRGASMEIPLGLIWCLHGDVYAFMVSTPIGGRGTVLPCGLRWFFHRAFMGLRWKHSFFHGYFHGASMELPWNFHRDFYISSMRFPCWFHGISMLVPRDFHVGSMGFPYWFHGTPWDFHDAFYSTPIGIPCCFHGASMGLLWDFH